MKNQIISTEQEYETKVNDFIINNGFIKMPMQSFLYGHQLYCQGKDIYKEPAAVLLGFIKDADVSLKTADDAFQVIEIQEDLAIEEEQHSIQR